MDTMILYKGGEASITDYGKSANPAVNAVLAAMFGSANHGLAHGKDTLSNTVANYAPIDKNLGIA